MSDAEQHSKLSPSASDRWLACSVAPSREANYPDNTNEAAEWGTAAHALAEWALRTKVHTLDFINDGTESVKWAKYLDDEMKACVQEYIKLVHSKMSTTADLYIEQRLTMFPEFGVYGTADAVVIDGNTIRVIDLKGGKGVFVETEDNPQLMLYAWGALDTLAWASAEEVTHIEVTVCQPRKNNTVSVTFTAEYLREWIAEQRPKVEKAFKAIGVGTPGEHCRWCRAKGDCAERAQANMALASFDFEDKAPTVPSCESLSEEQLVNIFVHIPQIRQYLTDVESEVTRRANAGYVAGVKFVAGRTTRKIVDEKIAQQALTAAGIDPMKPAELLGITEIEKRLKAIGLTVEAIIGDVVQKVEGNRILVGDADKRKALTAGDEFK